MQKYDFNSSININWILVFPKCEICLSLFFEIFYGFNYVFLTASLYSFNWFPQLILEYKQKQTKIYAYPIKVWYFFIQINLIIWTRDFNLDLYEIYLFICCIYSKSFKRKFYFSYKLEWKPTRQSGITII